MPDVTFKPATIKIICIGLALGFAYAFSSVYLAGRYMGETKKQRLLYLNQTVQLARNSIEPILAEYRNRKIVEKDAIEQIRSLIRLMVYRDHAGPNYVFLCAYDGTMLVQPFEPENEMTDMSGLKDDGGLLFIKALVDAARSGEGQGYVTYHYKRPGETTAQEKVSFVMGIPELDCLVGTGQYMGDIQKSRVLYILITAGLTLMLLLLLAFLVWASMKEIQTRNRMLHRAERELTAIFDNSFQFIGSLTPEGILKKANRTALKLVGMSETDVIGKPFWETPWWQGEELKGRLKKAIRDCARGEFIRFDAIHRNEEHGIIYVDFNISPVFNEKGEIVSLLAEGKDISEQIQTRNELLQEKVFLNNVIQSFPGLFFLYKLEDGQYRWKKWNEEQHKKILGFLPDDMKDAELHEIISEEDHPLLNSAVKQVLEEGNVYVQLDTKTKDNGTVPVLYLARHFEHSGESYIVGTGIELTEKIEAEEEKKKLEKMLAQAQKMEAIGSLAGGIAHDFNNILTALLGFAELVAEQLPPDGPEKTMQGEVITAALRAKNLIQQILLFSRQSEIEMKPVQMDLIVKEALKLLRSSIPATIEIRQNITRNSGAILADATQIHQIVMNLCTNAYHVMRESGGILTVALTERKVRKEDYIFSELSLSPGTYLLLEISDTGCGMDRLTLDRIFDPYFTTKRKGEGTGLGLSVVHGIVKASGGEIKVYSEPGQGTSFHVYFPKIGEKAEGEVIRSNVVYQTGSERLLLVDDDQTIINMMRQSLSTLGYQVSAFLSSQEALAAFMADVDGFDLVITDMTMPKMTGIDLSRKILSVRPQTPIILCTGYSELITREKAETMGIKAILLKPILREELSGTIRDVLDKEKRSK